MAYSKAKLEKQALDAIKAHNIKFVTHLTAFLPCSTSTLYDLGLEKSEAIKKAIETNRASAKVKALNRWESSENPTLEVAFYKLIGDDDEVERLNGSRQKLEHTGKDGNPIQTETKYDLSKLTSEQLKALKEIKSTLAT